jgi:hypothetical protein
MLQYNTVFVLKDELKTFTRTFLGQYGRYHAHLCSLLFERTMSDACAGHGIPNGNNTVLEIILPECHLEF